MQASFHQKRNQIMSYQINLSKKKFNVKKVMDHSFRIDVVQDTYYYISSFKELTLSLNEIRENIYE